MEQELCHVCLSLDPILGWLGYGCEWVEFCVGRGGPQPPSGPNLVYTAVTQVRFHWIWLPIADSKFRT